MVVNKDNKNLKGICGIYKITNLKNGKFYIGSAVDLLRRVNQHYSELKRDCHYNTYLQRSFKKNGESNFVFEVVEFVDYVENLLTREQFWIDTTRCLDKKIGYNMSPTAGSTLGFKHNEESKRKNSDAKSGENHPQAIITEMQAITIKTMLNNGLTPDFISKEININKEIIRGIRKGNSWTKTEPQLLKMENLKDKLIESDVIHIKEMLSNNNRVKDITSKFNVSYRTISAIKNNKNWNSIGEVVNYSKRAKLTELEAIEIKIMINNGHSNIEISEKFNTARNTISNIRHNKSWSYLNLEEVS